MWHPGEDAADSGTELRGFGFFIANGRIEPDVLFLERNQPGAGPEHASELAVIDMIRIRHARPPAVIKIDIVCLMSVLRDMNHGNAIDRTNIDLQGVVAAEDIVRPNFFEGLHAAQGKKYFSGNIGIETDISGRQ